VLIQHLPSFARLGGQDARPTAGGTPALRKPLTSYVSRVEAAGDRCVCGAFDDGSAVGEEGHLIGVGPELKDEIVVANRTVGFKAGADLLEIQGAIAFVNLDRVSPTEGDVRPAFAGEMYKVALTAGSASGARFSRLNFCPFVPPDVKREQGAAQMLIGAYEKLDRFGRRN